MVDRPNADAIEIVAQLVQVGCYVDEKTRKPAGPKGVTVTRRTRGFSQLLLKHSHPSPLVGLASAVSQRIAVPRDAEGALIVYPVYEETPEGLVGRHVVVMRLGELSLPSGADVRQTLSSVSLVFGWDDWKSASLNLRVLLSKGLELAPPTTADVLAGRQVIEPLRLKLAAEPVQSNIPPPAGRIIKAIEDGGRLLIGRETSESEADFLDLMSACLAQLPPDVRPHVSFASGYVRHEDGFQIAWMPDRALSDKTIGLKHAGGKADAARFGGIDAPTSKPGRKAGVTKAAQASAYASLLDGKRLFMRSVRKGVSQSLFRMTVKGRQETVPENVIDPSTLLRRRWIPPSHLKELLASSDVLHVIAEAVESGNAPAVQDLVLFTAVIADLSGPSFAELGKAWLKTLSPRDRSAYFFTAGWRNDPALLKTVGTLLVKERERLTKLGQPVPQWLTTARRTITSRLAAATPLQSINAPKARRSAGVARS